MVGPPSLFDLMAEIDFRIELQKTISSDPKPPDDHFRCQ